jgi:DNA ligase-4
MLSSVVREVPGYVCFASRTEASTVDELVTAANAVIESGMEGLILKRCSAIYKSDLRKKESWIKWKPDYMDQLADDFDLVVTGAFFGSGRRGGRLASFMCAVAVPGVGGARPTKFLSFCKVGGGFSIPMLDKINQRLAPFLRDFDSKNAAMARRVQLGKDRPDKFIDPEDSIIIQVKASEIQISDAFGTGISLRFPRFVKFRDDKVACIIFFWLASSMTLYLFCAVMV